MHAIEVLKEDHARVEALFNKLAEMNKNTIQAKFRIFGLLEKELLVHTFAEDYVFLPQVEDAIEESKKATNEFFDQSAAALEEATELITASYENHREIRILLEDMEECTVGDKKWEIKRAKLQETVTRQLEKEGELFPKAKKVLEDEDFERIGDLIEHCKWQVRGLTQAKLASSSSVPGVRVS